MCHPVRGRRGEPLSCQMRPEDAVAVTGCLLSRESGLQRGDRCRAGLRPAWRRSPPASRVAEQDDMRGLGRGDAGHQLGERGRRVGEPADQPVRSRRLGRGQAGEYRVPSRRNRWRRRARPRLGGREPWREHEARLELCEVGLMLGQDGLDLGLRAPRSCSPLRPMKACRPRRVPSRPTDISPPSVPRRQSRARGSRRRGQAWAPAPAR